MSIRAVIFDLGDTLFRLDPLPDVRPGLATVLSRLDVVEQVALGGVAGRLIAHVSEQRAAKTDLVESDLSAMFATAFEALGMPAGQLVAGDCADVLGYADLSRFAASASLDEDLAWFKAQGLVLGGVSNTTTRSAVLDGFLEAIGVRHLFDAVVYSSAHGYKKPHPSIYDEILARLGVEAGASVFVGDRVREDVLGPQSAGMRAVLTHEYRQEPLGEERPLAVIKSLPELRRLVDSI